MVGDIVEMKAKIIPLYGVEKSKTSYSPPNKHQHRCPLCRKMTMETGEVCGLSIDHVFACVPCLKEYRSRLESDSDVVGDIDLD